MFVLAFEAEPGQNKVYAEKGVKGGKGFKV